VVTGITTDPTLANCTIVQPDFASQLSAHNLSFRIPLQMFGLGLIDSIQDQTILNSFNATATQRAALGIAGHPNRSANDGTITRFGWKAQNKSITIFAAEAYNVEMGITNELFPTATEENPNCNGSGKPAPNDVTRMDDDDEVNQSFFNPVHILADWMQFQLLMRFMDAPQPDPNPSASAIRGKQVFNTIGCAFMPYPATADRARHEQRRAGEPTGEPVFRSARSSHGTSTCRQYCSGQRRPGRVPDHAAVGRRPAVVLLPWQSCPDYSCECCRCSRRRGG
jgi:CxxC motif-containing protein (DUF1111 family)